jgi:hypothetical protein
MQSAGNLGSLVQKLDHIAKLKPIKTRAAITGRICGACSVDCSGSQDTCSAHCLEVRGEDFMSPE